MGEYAMVNGQKVKLGTCEDLYYARLDQLRAATFGDRLPGNLPGKEYLNPAMGWRYRFPFPDEDSVALGCFEDYGRGVALSVPADMVDFEHDTVCVRVGANSSGFNVMLPCPQGEDFKRLGLQTSPRGGAYLEITQQKQVDAEVWVIVRCPFCHNSIRLDREEARKLCAHIRETWDLDRENMPPDDELSRELLFWREMERRIMAGYIKEA